MPAFAGAWWELGAEAIALALLPALFLLALLLRALDAPAWRESFLAAVSKIAPRAGALLRGAGGSKKEAAASDDPQRQRRRRASGDDSSGGGGGDDAQHDQHDQHAKKKHHKNKWYVTRAELDYFESVVQPVEARLLAGEPLGAEWSLVLAMSNDAPGPKPQYAYRSYMRALPNGTSEYL